MMSKSYIKNPYIISCILICFLAQDMAWGASELIKGPSRLVATTATQVLANPSNIQVPYEHATLKEIHQSSSTENQKLIILIEDAHSNFSGQMSLAGSLDELMRTYGFSLVLAEGSSKDVTLDEVKDLADAKTWQIAAKRFLMEGVISGEEYLNLTSDLPMSIRGMEYQDLYEKNLNTYSNLVKRRRDILLYLHKINTSLSKVKTKLYPQGLLDYEKARVLSESEGGGFTPYLDDFFKLQEEAQIKLIQDYPEVSQLKQLRLKEKAIDFALANREQGELYRSISQKGAKEEINHIIEASKRSKNLQISQYSLLTRVFTLAKKYGIDSNNYKELGKYYDYLKAFTELKLNPLLEQIERLEDEFYKILLIEEDTRRVRIIDRYVGLLDKAYRIQMSSTDFKAFIANRPDFNTQSWEAFLNLKLEELDYLEDLIPYLSSIDDAEGDLRDFYETVNDRDEAFVENAERIMQEEDQQAAFMIAGGYHTHNLTRLLREKDYSYVVLTPVVTFETDHNKYEQLLLMPLENNTISSTQSTPATNDLNQNQDTTLRQLALLLSSRLSIMPDVGNLDVPRLAARLTKINAGRSSNKAARLTYKLLNAPLGDPVRGSIGAFSFKIEYVSGGTVRVVLTDTRPRGLGEIYNEEIDLSKEKRISIGRHSDSTIVLSDNAVSRLHAIITLEPSTDGAQIIIQDSKSRNGTYIANGEITEPTLLFELSSDDTDDDTVSPSETLIDQSSPIAIEVGDIAKAVSDNVFQDYRVVIYRAYINALDQSDANFTSATGIGAVKEEFDPNAEMIANVPAQALSTGLSPEQQAWLLIEANRQQLIPLLRELLSAEVKAYARSLKDLKQTLINNPQLSRQDVNKQLATSHSVLAELVLRPESNKSDINKINKFRLFLNDLTESFNPQTQAKARQFIQALGVAVSRLRANTDSSEQPLFLQEPFSALKQIFITWHESVGDENLLRQAALSAFRGTTEPTTIFELIGYTLRESGLQIEDLDNKALTVAIERYSHSVVDQERQEKQAEKEQKKIDELDQKRKQAHVEIKVIQKTYDLDENLNPKNLHWITSAFRLVRKKTPPSIREATSKAAIIKNLIEELSETRVDKDLIDELKTALAWYNHTIYGPKLTDEERKVLYALGTHTSGLLDSLNRYEVSAGPNIHAYAHLTQVVNGINVNVFRGPRLQTLIALAEQGQIMLQTIAQRQKAIADDVLKQLSGIADQNPSDLTRRLINQRRNSIAGIQRRIDNVLTLDFEEIRNMRPAQIEDLVNAAIDQFQDFDGGTVVEAWNNLLFEGADDSIGLGEIPKLIHQKYLIPGDIILIPSGEWRHIVSVDLVGDSYTYQALDRSGNIIEQVKRNDDIDNAVAESRNLSQQVINLANSLEAELAKEKRRGLQFEAQLNPENQYAANRWYRASGRDTRIQYTAITQDEQTGLLKLENVRASPTITSPGGQFVSNLEYTLLQQVINRLNSKTRAARMAAQVRGGLELQKGNFGDDIKFNLGNVGTEVVWSQDGKTIRLGTEDQFALTIKLNESKTFKIGRISGNQFIVLDDSVESQHAELEVIVEENSVRVTLSNLSETSPIALAGSSRKQAALPLRVESNISTTTLFEFNKRSTPQQVSSDDSDSGSFDPGVEGDYALPDGLLDRFRRDVVIVSGDANLNRQSSSESAAESIDIPAAGARLEIKFIPGPQKEIREISIANINGVARKSFRITDLVNGISVGRDPKQNIVIAHKRVSREHLKFSVDRDGNVFVNNLGSNTTNHNGVKIEQGQKILLSQLKLSPAEKMLVLGSMDGDSSAEQNIFSDDVAAAMQAHEAEEEYRREIESDIQLAESLVAAANESDQLRISSDAIIEKSIEDIEIPSPEDLYLQNNDSTAQADSEKVSELLSRIERRFQQEAENRADGGVTGQYIPEDLAGPLDQLVEDLIRAEFFLNNVHTPNAFTQKELVYLSQLYRASKADYKTYQGSDADILFSRQIPYGIQALAYYERSKETLLSDFPGNRGRIIIEMANRARGEISKHLLFQANKVQRAFERWTVRGSELGLEQADSSPEIEFAEELFVEFYQLNVQSEDIAATSFDRLLQINDQYEEIFEAINTYVKPGDILIGQRAEVVRINEIPSDGQDGKDTLYKVNLDGAEVDARQSDLDLWFGQDVSKSNAHTDIENLAEIIKQSIIANVIEARGGALFSIEFNSETNHRYSLSQPNIAGEYVIPGSGIKPAFGIFVQLDDSGFGIKRGDESKANGNAQKALQIELIDQAIALINAESADSQNRTSLKKILASRMSLTRNGLELQDGNFGEVVNLKLGEFEGYLEWSADGKSLGFESSSEYSQRFNIDLSTEATYTIGYVAPWRTQAPNPHHIPIVNESVEKNHAGIRVRIEGGVTTVSLVIIDHEIESSANNDQGDKKVDLLNAETTLFQFSKSLEQDTAEDYSELLPEYRFEPLTGNEVDVNTFEYSGFTIRTQFRREDGQAYLYLEADRAKGRLIQRVFSLSELTRTLNIRGERHYGVDLSQTIFNTQDFEADKKSRQRVVLGMGLSENGEAQIKLTNLTNEPLRLKQSSIAVRESDVLTTTTLTSPEAILIQRILSEAALNEDSLIDENFEDDRIIVFDKNEEEGLGIDDETTTREINDSGEAGAVKGDLSEEGRSEGESGDVSFVEEGVQPTLSAKVVSGEGELDGVEDELGEELERLNTPKDFMYATGFVTALGEYAKTLEDQVKQQTLFRNVRAYLEGWNQDQDQTNRTSVIGLENNLQDEKLEEEVDKGSIAAIIVKIYRDLRQDTSYEDLPYLRSDIESVFELTNKAILEQIDLKEKYDRELRIESWIGLSRKYSQQAQSITTDKLTLDAYKDKFKSTAQQDLQIVETLIRNLERRQALELQAREAGEQADFYLPKDLEAEVIPALNTLREAQSTLSTLINPNQATQISASRMGDRWRNVYSNDSEELSLRGSFGGSVEFTFKIEGNELVLSIYEPEQEVKEERISLNETSFTAIGRRKPKGLEGKEKYIIISDLTVSGQHAQLNVREMDGVFQVELTDKSSNGTFFNGIKIAKNEIVPLFSNAASAELAADDLDPLEAGEYPVVRLPRLEDEFALEVDVRDLEQAEQELRKRIEEAAGIIDRAAASEDRRINNPDEDPDVAVTYYGLKYDARALKLSQTHNILQEVHRIEGIRESLLEQLGKLSVIVDGGTTLPDTTKRLIAASKQVLDELVRSESYIQRFNRPYMFKLTDGETKRLNALFEKVVPIDGIPIFKRRSDRVEYNSGLTDAEKAFIYRGRVDSIVRSGRGDDVVDRSSSDKGVVYDFPGQRADLVHDLANQAVKSAKRYLKLQESKAEAALLRWNSRLKDTSEKRYLESNSYNVRKSWFDKRNTKPSTYVEYVEAHEVLRAIIEESENYAKLGDVFQAPNGEVYEITKPTELNGDVRLDQSIETLADLIRVDLDVTPTTYAKVSFGSNRNNEDATLLNDPGGVIDFAEFSITLTINDTDETIEYTINGKPDLNKEQKLQKALIIRAVALANQKKSQPKSTPADSPEASDAWTKSRRDLRSSARMGEQDAKKFDDSIDKGVDELLRFVSIYGVDGFDPEATNVTPEEIKLMQLRTAVLIDAPKGKAINIILGGEVFTLELSNHSATLGSTTNAVTFNISRGELIRQKALSDSDIKTSSQSIILPSAASVLDNIESVDAVRNRVQIFNQFVRRLRRKAAQTNQKIHFHLHLDEGIGDTETYQSVLSKLVFDDPLLEVTLSTFTGTPVAIAGEDIGDEIIVKEIVFTGPKGLVDIPGNEFTVLNLGESGDSLANIGDVALRGVQLASIKLGDGDALSAGDTQRALADLMQGPASFENKPTMQAVEYMYKFPGTNKAVKVLIQFPAKRNLTIEDVLRIGAMMEKSVNWAA